MFVCCFLKQSLVEKLSWQFKKLANATFILDTVLKFVPQLTLYMTEELYIFVVWVHYMWQDPLYVLAVLEFSVWNSAFW